MLSGKVPCLSCAWRWSGDHDKTRSDLASKVLSFFRESVKDEIRRQKAGSSDHPIIVVDRNGLVMQHRWQDFCRCAGNLQSSISGWLLMSSKVCLVGATPHYSQHLYQTCKSFIKTACLSVLERTARGM